VKSFLAGVADLIMAALLFYGLALGVSRIFERIPLGEGGTGAYGIGLFQCNRWWLWALFIFGSAFYWGFPIKPPPEVLREWENDAARSSPLPVRIPGHLRLN
jgi:hypothetical protein